MLFVIVFNKIDIYLEYIAKYGNLRLEVVKYCFSL